MVNRLNNIPLFLSDTEVMFLDCDESPLSQLEMLAREICLPLLCSETARAAEYGVSADKLMDILHRLLSTVDVTKGNIQVCNSRLNCFVE